MKAFSLASPRFLQELPKFFSAPPPPRPPQTRLIEEALLKKRVLYNTVQKSISQDSVGRFPQTSI